MKRLLLEIVDSLEELDDLVEFAIHCTSYKRAVARGVEPLTFEQFAEAVNERMPEKEEAEKAYLLRRFNELTKERMRDGN